MATCRKCGEKFPLFTIREARHPSPLGDGDLCRECYRPYGLVLEKYTTNLKKTDRPEGSGMGSSLLPVGGTAG